MSKEQQQQQRRDQQQHQYQSLYRKFRPASFAEVKGQEHIVSVLEKALARGAVAHSYLFTGSRGTGKTSVARILAEAIGTTKNDLYEIDAASNRGIDDIRNIKASVDTLPFESKYKVYIVDEVHMLTKEAFNALLKTLEEPPKHVVFVLATTEVEKIPETIVSRCQVFSFKKPSLAVLKETITKVASSEGFTLEPSSADLVALLGDGSFRDSLGILQKVLSFSDDKKISAEEVERVTGAPTITVLMELIQALHEKDSASAIQVLHKISDSGVDMQVFTKMLIRSLRFILLLAHAPAMKSAVAGDCSQTELDFYENIVKNGKDGKVGQGGQDAQSGQNGGAVKNSGHSGLSPKLLADIIESLSYTPVAYSATLPLELAFLKNI